MIYKFFAKIKLLFVGKQTKGILNAGKNNINKVKSLISLLLVATCFIANFTFALDNKAKVYAATAPILPNNIEVSSDPNLLDSKEDLVDYSWYMVAGAGTIDIPYEIHYGSELAALSRIVNGSVNITYGISKDSFEGKYIKLMPRDDKKGIDLIMYGGAFYWNTDQSEVFITKIGGISENKGWMPIGNSSVNPFKGNFDGNNIVIRNLSADCLADDATRAIFGLFGNVDFTTGGSIKNINLTRLQVRSTNRTGNLGAVVGNGIFNPDENQVDNLGNNSKADQISNCSVNEQIIEGSSNFSLKTVMVENDESALGGIIGKASNLILNNCSFNGTIELENKMINATSSSHTSNLNSTKHGKGIGGIIGSLNKNTTISNNNTQLIFEVKSNRQDHGYVGMFTGIGGIAGIANDVNIKINKNISTVKMTTDYFGEKAGVGGTIGIVGTSLIDAINDIQTKVDINNSIVFCDFIVKTTAYLSSANETICGGLGGIGGVSNSQTDVNKSIANVNIDVAGLPTASHANIGGIFGAVNNAVASSHFYLKESFATGNIKGNLSNKYNDGAIGGFFGRFEKAWLMTQNSIENSFNTVTINAISFDANKAFTSAGFSGYSSSSPNMYANSYFAGFSLNSWTVSVSPTINATGPSADIQSYYDYQNSPSLASTTNPEITTAHAKFARSFDGLSSPDSSLNTGKWLLSDTTKYPQLSWINKLTEDGNYNKLAKSLSAIATTRTVEFNSDDHAYAVTSSVILAGNITGLPNGVTAMVDWKNGDNTISSGEHTVTDDEILSFNTTLKIDEKIYLLSSDKRFIKSSFTEGNGLQNGAVTTPYKLKTASEIVTFGNLMNTNKAFIGMSAELTADSYDFAGISINDSVIGKGTLDFIGNFNGNNKPISNFKATFSKDKSGFFGNTTNADIKNLNIISSSVTSSNNYFGVLAGYIVNTKITNSNIVGEVKTQFPNPNQSAGGLVGWVKSGCSISNSSFKGTLIGGTSGGIAGKISNSNIQNCYVLGDIGNEASDTAGGIVGYIENSAGRISNTYFVGNVVAKNKAGGIVGDSTFTDSINSYMLENSYATGSIYGTSTACTAGGLIGNGEINGAVATTVRNSYFAGQVNSAGKIGGLSGSEGIFVNSYYDQQLTGAIPALGSSGDIAGTNKTTAELAGLAQNLGSAYVQKAGFYPQLKDLQSDTEDFATNISYDLKNNIHAFNVKTDFQRITPTAAFISTTSGAPMGFTSLDNLLYTPIEGDTARGKVIFDVSLNYGKSINNKDLTLTIKTNLVNPIFEIGDGTVTRPYQIPNEETLQGLASWISSQNDVGGTYYILTKPNESGPYDLSTIPNWTPIADKGSSFSSFLNGNNKIITGLQTTCEVINSVDIFERGLFGSIAGGYIKDLVITNANVNIVNNQGAKPKPINIGILAGSITSASITNVSVQGNIIAKSTIQVHPDTEFNLGGLAGLIKDTEKVEDIYANVKVTAIEENNSFSKEPTINMGGVSGKVENDGSGAVTFTRCISYADITGIKNKKKTYGGSIIGQYESSIPVSQNGFYVNNSFTSGTIRDVQFSASVAAAVKSLNNTILNVKVDKFTSTTDMATTYTLYTDSMRSHGILVETRNIRLTLNYVNYCGVIDKNINPKGSKGFASPSDGGEIITNSFMDVSKNDLTKVEKSQKKSTLDFSYNYKPDGFVNQDYFYPYPDFKTDDINQFGNAKLKADAISTANINTAAVFYANAKNGVSSIYVLAPNASLSLDAGNPNITLTTAGKRAASTATSPNLASVKVNVAGEPSVSNKYAVYKPSIESTGKKDISYAIANPTDKIHTLYTADSLAGLSLLTEGILTDDNLNATTSVWNNAQINIGANIDAAAYEKNFPIIGNEVKPFKSVFDGQYFTIKNLYINSNVTNVGLFGVVENTEYTGIIDDNLSEYEKDNIMASIKNFGIISSSIIYNGTASANVGSLIGKAKSNVKIDSCFSSAVVTAQNTATVNLGGFIGHTTDNNLSISNSYFTGNVVTLADSKNIFSGGFIGNSAGIATIKRSFVAGFVDGTETKLGAVAGKAANLTLISVHADRGTTGNIPGIGSGSANGNVINVETNGITTSTDGKKPTGLDANYPSVSNNTIVYNASHYPQLKGFTNDDVSSIPVNFVAHSRSVTSADIKTQGYKFQTYIPLPAGYLGAYIINNDINLTKTISGKSIVKVVNATDDTQYRDVYMELKCWYEQGAASNIYTISNAYELLELSGILNKKQNANHVHENIPEEFYSATFNISNDIDMSVIEKWLPIGENFKGILNGNGFSIQNLITDVGLFTVLDGGTVENLGFSNSQITTTDKDFIGLVAGETKNNATINNCYNLSSIEIPSSTNITFGTLVGKLDGKSKVFGCYNMGTIFAEKAPTSIIGGIVGENNGEIDSCYNTGIIRYGSVVAGITAQNNYIVKNSYNAALLLDATLYEPITNGKSPENSYYDKQINIETYTNGTGVNTNALKKGTGLAPAVWTIKDGYYPQITANVNSVNPQTVLSSMVSAVAVDYIAPSGIGSYNNILRVQLKSNENISGVDTTFNTQISSNPNLKSAGSFDVEKLGDITVLNPKAKGQTYVTISANNSSKEYSRDFMFHIELLLTVKYKFTFEDFGNKEPPHDTISLTKDEWQAPNNAVGTAANPSKIATANDLKAFSAYVNSNDTTNKHFRLVSNISMSAISSFIPIGTDISPFRGTFDGSSFVVSNLSQTGVFTGLFGVIGSKGKVRQVGLVNQSIALTGTNKDLIGGLISAKNNGVIQNCYSIGAMTISNPTAGKYVKVGGVSGINKGRITGSYIRPSKTTNYIFESSATNREYTNLGALIGENSGYVNGCYVTVDGTYTGLAAGYVFAGVNSGTISNTYYDSTVAKNTNASLYRDNKGNEVKDATAKKTSLELKNQITTSTTVNMAHQLSWDLYLGTYEFIQGKNNGYPVHGGVLLSDIAFDNISENSSIIFNLQNKKKSTQDEYNVSNAVCSYINFSFPQFGKLAIGQKLDVNLLDLTSNLSYTVASSVYYGYNDITKEMIKQINLNPGNSLNTQDVVENCNRLEINIIIKKEDVISEIPWGVRQTEIFPIQ